jgi:hypothetical protein
MIGFRKKKKKRSRSVLIKKQFQGNTCWFQTIRQGPV